MSQFSSLNPQQREAVETIHGPVLILAGAGTGKTRVITHRIARLIARGIPPHRLLAVTFTNKAAREMQERVRKLVPQWPKGNEPDVTPTICTFHSLCVRILRQHIEKLGYKRNFVIYDESDQLGVIRKVLAHLHAPGVKLDPAETLAAVSRLKNGGRLRLPEAHAHLEQLRGKYQSSLKACNAVDFDDLILLTLRLFTEHPAALEACRERFRYVMVDEYQDTNAAQFELVHALTRQHRNLCVVGDDDQSIYAWRGAEISNLLEMERYFPEVKVIKLEQNYRSTNTILNAANALIKHNARRRAKKLWSEMGDGAKIARHTFANEEEEAQSIADQIQWSRAAERAPWSHHAVLFRTNAQSRPIETALRQANIRYRLVGGQSFYDRREIRDFLAYLKTLVNPHDDINLLRIANVPARGLSEASMESLLAASQERKCSVFSVMKNAAATTPLSARARHSLESFVTLIEQTRGALLRGFPADSRALQTWANRFVAEIGYLDHVHASEKTTEAAENRILNLKELIETLDQSGAPGASGMERLEAFLDDISLDAEREEENTDTGDAVTLITMHSCKGLEFPYVHVAGVEEGLVPHARSEDEGSLDEERRLFYVAVTRAMRRLALSHCATRKKYGQKSVRHPSRFLKELPPNLVEHAEEQTRKPVSVASARQMFSALRAHIGADGGDERPAQLGT
jgi:superfamily I DNA/RNA helicase